MKQLKSIVLMIMATLFFGLAGKENVQTEPNKAMYLDEKEKSIIVIASLTAKGDLENLKNALTEGLNSGLKVNEIKEVMVHLYAYCGFPRSLRGLQTFIKVLVERKAKGILDSLGAEASPIEDTLPKYDRGKKVLEDLVQTKSSGPPADYAQFAPIIEIFLKEHLFADIFERDVLDYRQRELVTVSVLATIGDVEPMLRSHLNICLIQGISVPQLEEMITLLEKNVDEAKIKSAKEVLNLLVQSKK